MSTGEVADCNLKIRKVHEPRRTANSNTDDTEITYNDEDSDDCRCLVHHPVKNGSCIFHDIANHQNNCKVLGKVVPHLVVLAVAHGRFDVHCNLYDIDESLIHACRTYDFCNV